MSAEIDDVLKFFHGTESGTARCIHQAKNLILL